jgi:hypothetical protein
VSLIGDMMGTVTATLLATHGDADRVTLRNGSDTATAVTAIVGVSKQDESPFIDDLGRQWDDVVAVTIAPGDFTGLNHATVVAIDGSDYAIAGMRSHDAAVTMMCSRARLVEGTRPDYRR